ncbi:ABC transporter permease [Lacrimispora sp. NSJ-141]|uniref:ABC transporter permease n=1 Tax=Lientehia hominis TaxID=2897778 RepID=A0AAP2W9M2_9FIRM|nr:ABC transporter permease [Lientehia hominis]MCD2493525.1 ABC transporter permease [Lientehia hominis]
MKVFKACLLIMKRHKGQILIYLIIFMGIFVVISAFMSTKITPDFSETKPEFTVINRDKETAFTEGLRGFLSNHGTEVILDDKKDVLQDAMFYHATEYILIIPEGFDASLATETPISLEMAAVPGTGDSYYLDNLVNQYWSFINTYQKTGSQMDDEVLVSKALESLSLETSVETMRFSTGQPMDDAYYAYNRVQSYILLVLILLCVSSVTLSFKRPELQMRNLCAPTTVRAKNFGQFLYCGVVSLFVWLLLSVMGIILSAGRLAGTDWRLIGLMLLNSFLFSVTSLAISMLVSHFIKNPNTQNAFANFLGLALSFLGGAFVPLEFLSQSIQAFSRFTPVYWYSKAVTGIYSLTSLDRASLRPIWQAFGIELAFAAAILCVSLALGKYKSRAENSFGSIRTELDS